MMPMELLERADRAVASAKLGRSFSNVADIRLIADYADEEVGRDQAAWAVEEAITFVKAMHSLVKSTST